MNSLDHLDVFSYPDDILKNRDFVQKVIFGHDHGIIMKNNSKGKDSSNQKEKHEVNHFSFDCPVPQVIDDLNVYTSCINSKMIIGLIFDKDDNPYDYKEVFEDLLSEMLNNKRCCEFEDEMQTENFLITLFIDIRRYGDEYIEKSLEISLKPTGIFTKVFLFGIDDVGKTSFAHRIKTGKFIDNSFTPNRKFNIEYIQKQNGYLALWDMPGQRAFRDKWFKGIQDTNIIIYMIDAANQLRFEESKRELWNFINKYESSGIPLIILGNKTDLIKKTDEDINSLNRTRQEIIEFFELDRIKDREYFFFLTSVKTNYHIKEVLDTLFNTI